MLYLEGPGHFNAREKLLSCFEKYPTRILLSCLAAALLVLLVSCSQNEETGPVTRELSNDELYLIEAYVKVKHARSLYPQTPAIAESLFVVLDSTIDSVRIANTIQSLNQDPARWETIFDKLEKTMRESASTINSGRSRSEKPGG